MPHNSNAAAALLNDCDRQRLKQAEVLRELGTRGTKFDRVGFLIFGHEMSRGERCVLRLLTFMFGFRRGMGGHDDIRNPRYSPTSMLPNGDRQMPLTTVLAASVRQYSWNNISARHGQRLFKPMENHGLVLVPRNRSLQAQDGRWDRDMIYRLNVEKLWDLIAQSKKRSLVRLPEPSREKDNREYVRRSSKATRSSAAPSDKNGVVFPPIGVRGGASGERFVPFPDKKGISYAGTAEESPSSKGDGQKSVAGPGGAQPEPRHYHGAAAEYLAPDPEVTETPNTQMPRELPEFNPDRTRIDPPVVVVLRPDGLSARVTPTPEAVPYNSGPETWSARQNEVELARMLESLFTREPGVCSWSQIIYLARLPESRGQLNKFRLALVAKLLFRTETDNERVNNHPFVESCGSSLWSSDYAHLDCAAKIRDILRYCYPASLNPSGDGDSEAWLARRDLVAFLNNWLTLWRETEQLMSRFERDQLAQKEFIIRTATPELLRSALSYYNADGCTENCHVDRDAWAQLSDVKHREAQAGFEAFMRTWWTEPANATRLALLRPTAVAYFKTVPALVKSFVDTAHPVAEWFEQEGEDFNAALASAHEFLDDARRTRNTLAYRGIV